MSDQFLILEKIIGCARCGLDHESIIAERLVQPMAPPELLIIWTYWAKCPTNGQPIMIGFSKGEDA